MSNAKLEFIARIITEDGREIECKEVQNIPSPENVDIGNVNSFLQSFDEYEHNALSVRNKICEDITQAWLDAQAKKGVL